MRDVDTRYRKDIYYFSLSYGMVGRLITLATNITGNWFLMRRRAWWADLKIFFATWLGIMHRVAGRVSVSFSQLFLKRFSKMLESGLEPTREKNGRSGDRTHAGLPNPCYTACVTGVRMSARPRESAEPLLHSVCNRGSAPRRSRTPVTLPV